LVKELPWLKASSFLASVVSSWFWLVIRLCDFQCWHQTGVRNSSLGFSCDPSDDVCLDF